MSLAPSYGLDWFEGAIAQPDKVLQDFIHAVNPSNSSARNSHCFISKLNRTPRASYFSDLLHVKLVVLDE